MGSALVQFGLVWWLTQSTGSATILATATALAVIPEIIISPFAGAMVDRWNRRKVIIYSDSLIAIVTLALAILFIIGKIQVWHIYVTMFIRAVGSAFHYPAETASIALMVPADQLSRIAGLNQALRGVLGIMAPPLGALLLELSGVHATLAVDILTALAAVIILLFIQIPQPENAVETYPGMNFFTTILADMHAGLRYLLRWKGAVELIGLAMIFKIALSPAFSLHPLLVSSHFNGGAAEYSLVEAASGVGVVAGGLLLGIWGGFKRKIFSTLTGIFGIGSCMLLISVLSPHSLTLLVVITFFIGVMIPITDGPMNAIMQTSVAPEFQGRVFTLIGSLVWLTTPLGLAFAGPLADHFGLQIWYLAAGVLCLLSGAAAFMIPQLVRIEENNRLVSESTKKQK